MYLLYQRYSTRKIGIYRVLATLFLIKPRKEIYW